MVLHVGEGSPMPMRSSVENRFLAHNTSISLVAVDALSLASMELKEVLMQRLERQPVQERLLQSLSSVFLEKNLLQPRFLRDTSFWWLARCVAKLAKQKSGHSATVQQATDQLLPLFQEVLEAVLPGPWATDCDEELWLFPAPEEELETHMMSWDTLDKLLQEAVHADKLCEDHKTQSSHPFRKRPLEDRMELLNLYKQAVESNVLELSSCLHLAKHAHQVTFNWLERQRQQQQQQQQEQPSIVQRELSFSYMLQGAKYECLTFDDYFGRSMIINEI